MANKFKVGDRIVIIKDPDKWFAGHGLKVGDTGTIIKQYRRFNDEPNSDTGWVKFDRPLNSRYLSPDTPVAPFGTHIAHIGEQSFQYRAKLAEERGYLILE